MHLPSIILSLAAASTVSAIDAYLHYDRDCNGPSAVCTNINPTVCCGDPNGIFQSIGYRGIPTNWKINAMGYTGGGCVRLVHTAYARNTNFVCIPWYPGNLYQATGYLFASKKRGVEEEMCESKRCESTQRPDKLVLADGSSFDLKGLDGQGYEKLLQLGASAATAADIPQQFQRFAVKA